MGRHLKVILVAVVSLLSGLIVGRLWPHLAPTTQDPECDPFTKYYRNPCPTGDPLTEYQNGDPLTKYYTGDPHPATNGTYTTLDGGAHAIC